MKQHRLLQDIYSHDPWKVLVSCIMLNNSNRKAVDKVRHNFFEIYSSAGNVDYFDDVPIAEIIKPTGLQNVKAKRIIEMSVAYCMLSPFELENAVQSMALPGVGEYARDSWNIFINKDYTVNPDDKELILYLDGHYGGPGVTPINTPKVSIK